MRFFYDGDQALTPYIDHFQNWRRRTEKTKVRLTQRVQTLLEFASGHEYFGLHFKEGHWTFREWAPNAHAIFLIGEMSHWQEDDRFALTKIDPHGIWEIHLPQETFTHGMLYRLRVHWTGEIGDRIPAYCRRVVQDPGTLIFNAQVWRPEPYAWRHEGPVNPSENFLVYEAHVGMAQEEGKIGTFREFTTTILPKIVKAGYTTLQLMAIQEHAYYASFGYQVSSFFATTSKFGTPEELKELVDTAHGYGLRVIMDLIHSHGLKNEVEGLSRFDGTSYQYFHEGARGHHEAWDSRCFDYGKVQILHFLLSNLRYFLDEFRFDGFRFDGITSILYDHHGINKTFLSYEDYFNGHLDVDAIVYLRLANTLVHELRPEAITIAEDVSGLPGLAASLHKGGIGFDYRFAMGIPDFWIRLIKDYRDEDWPLGLLWHELTNRREEEKTISYAESHDQALVGDQTLFFRLTGSHLYEDMHKSRANVFIDRAIALHKMIRCITATTAGAGYLTFMGNEFGHPEWIDFPRAENNWSYHYARRQWHLMANKELKYHYLSDFDRDLLRLIRTYSLYSTRHPNLLLEHTDDKIVAFERNTLIFIFNFHPTLSHEGYPLKVQKGRYRMILDSDALKYGGYGRLEEGYTHVTHAETHADRLVDVMRLYLPTRTGMVLYPMA